MKDFVIRTDKKEVYRLLGYGNSEPDALTESQIRDCISDIENKSEPNHVYKVFDLERSVSGQLRLKGTSFVFDGSDAEKLLEECHKCILLAVTLGRKTDNMIMKAQVRNMALAVITDCCASVAVEDLCHQINNCLEEQYLEQGLYLTDRFSPGYGDMPLELQDKLCIMLNTERTIGLTVTPAMVLTPTKSITAVIGISDRPQPKRITGCSNCRLKDDCQFRKQDQTCGR